MTICLMLRWKTLCTILLPVLVTLMPAFIHDASAQRNTAPTGRLLQKSADIGEAKTASKKRSSIVIQVYGLQPSDLINVHPKGARLVASAGTLNKSLSQYGGAPNEPFNRYETVPYEAITPGPALPEASLEVTTKTVTFFRPAPIDNVVFLDIEVPVGAWLKVRVDGELILNAVLEYPLLLRNKQLGEGAQGIPGTVLKAALPLISKSNPSEQAAYDHSKGAYVIPYSKLQAVKKTSLNLQRGQNVVVMLQIDETGRVIKVTPMTVTPVANLEGAIMQWRFAPYEVQGRAVAIITVLRIASDSQ